MVRAGDILLAGLWWTRRLHHIMRTWTRSKENLNQVNCFLHTWEACIRKSQCVPRPDKGLAWLLHVGGGK